MGKIVTTLTITNRADQIRADCSYISPEQIRSIALDTYSSIPVLPPSACPRRRLRCAHATRLRCALRARYAIAQLGLDLLKEVDVITAAGLKKARIFQDAKISLLGREGTFECLELPGQGDALLGVIPLEAYGYATLREWLCHAARTVSNWTCATIN